jgi:hypothetical protein
VSHCGDCEHHSGQERGWRGKVNTRESLINVVSISQRKVLHTLGPHGLWAGVGVPHSPTADVAPPAERRDLPPAGPQAERGKPVGIPRGVTTASATVMLQQVQDGGESEGPTGIAGRGVATSSHAQAGRLLPGLSARERWANRCRRQSQGQEQARRVQPPPRRWPGTASMGRRCTGTSVGSKPVSCRQRRREDGGRCKPCTTSCPTRAAAERWPSNA